MIGCGIHQISIQLLKNKVLKRTRTGFSKYETDKLLGDIDVTLNKSKVFTDNLQKYNDHSKVRKSLTVIIFIDYKSIIFVFMGEGTGGFSHATAVRVN